MALPLLPIAISLASKFAPTLLSKLFGKDAGNTAEKVVDLAIEITGEADNSKLLQILTTQPNLAKKFQEQANMLSATLYKEDTERIYAVNQSMQAEAKSESVWQRSWRPFNGFLFGITLWCDYFLAPIILKIAGAQPLDHMPMEVYLLWTTVLGVTAWTRGQEKLKRLNLFK